MAFGQLLSYLSTLHPAEELDFATLSKKTATLVRLSTNSRSSLLKLLSNEPIFENTRVTFPLMALEKQSRVGHVRGWVSCATTNNPRLDVAHHVRIYLNKTLPFRTGTAFFLAISKPHNPVTTATTFAKWTLDLMSKANIDTSKFTSHSTRSSVPANLSKLKTLSLDQILKRTDWSNVRTFKTFYNKQVAGAVAAASRGPTEMGAATGEEEEESDPVRADPLINFSST